MVVFSAIKESFSLDHRNTKRIGPVNSLRFACSSLDYIFHPDYGPDTFPVRLKTFKGRFHSYLCSALSQKYRSALLA
jgi:hypothetical protein